MQRDRKISFIALLRNEWYENEVCTLFISKKHRLKSLMFASLNPVMRMICKKFG